MLGHAAERLTTPVAHHCRGVSCAERGGLAGRTVEVHRLQDGGGGGVDQPDRTRRLDAPAVLRRCLLPRCDPAPRAGLVGAAAAPRPAPTAIRRSIRGRAHGCRQARPCGCPARGWPRCASVVETAGRSGSGTTARTRIRRRRRRDGPAPTARPCPASPAGRPGRRSAWPAAASVSKAAKTASGSGADLGEHIRQAPATREHRVPRRPLPSELDLALRQAAPTPR